MSEAPLFVLRAMGGPDTPFVYHSFLKSYRDAPSVAGIPNSLYYAGQHALIERLLDHSAVIVACSADDPSQIMGYGIGRLSSGPGGAATVHWVYVKHPFRGFGIGKALEGALVQGASTVSYTHRVKACDRFMRSRPYVYNPFLLYGAP